MNCLTWVSDLIFLNLNVFIVKEGWKQCWTIRHVRGCYKEMMILDSSLSFITTSLQLPSCPGPSLTLGTFIPFSPSLRRTCITILYLDLLQQFPNWLQFSNLQPLQFICPATLGETFQKHTSDQAVPLLLTGWSQTVACASGPGTESAWLLGHAPPTCSQPQLSLHFLGTSFTLIYTSSFTGNAVPLAWQANNCSFKWNLESIRSKF